MTKELTITDGLVARFTEFLSAIARGEPLENAMLSHSITTAELNLLTRADPLLDQRWHDARLAGELVAWSALAFEDVCSRISAGQNVNDAILAVRGAPDPSFFRIVDGIPQRKAQFMAAMRAWSLVQAQELEAIAADTSRDVISGPKGDIPNMAAVQRDRLRVDTKKSLLTAFNREMFGDRPSQTNIQVNINHAERLAEARARAKTRDGDKLAQDAPRVTKEQMREAVDAVFTSREGEAPIEAAVEPAAAADHMRAEAAAACADPDAEASAPSALSDFD